MHKAGFVNIVGNPNVGKSTLMNQLVGERISIATFKAQTTRHRIMGIVNADDLGGDPVYMNLKATDRAPALDAKEAEKKEKSMKGIIYNIPGKANIEIIMNRKTLYKGEAQITQFGTREGLAPVMFEDKKAPVKVYFYPETGAIKQIIQ